MEMALYLGFIALMGLLRLVELAVSKRNWKRHRERARQLPEPIFRWMVLLHGGFFLLVPLELLWRRPAFGGWLSILAVTLTLSALLLRCWTLKTIGKAWNVRIVYGRDYPIVSSGPYRFIRHPNYLVVILELLWIPLIYHLYFSALLLTLANALVLRARIAEEERVLFENPAWVAGMAHKSRFLPSFRTPRR